MWGLPVFLVLAAQPCSLRQEPGSLHAAPASQPALAAVSSCLLHLPGSPDAQRPPSLFVHSLVVAQSTWLCDWHSARESRSAANSQQASHPRRSSRHPLRAATSAGFAPSGSASGMSAVHPQGCFPGCLMTLTVWAMEAGSSLPSSPWDRVL